MHTYLYDNVFMSYICLPHLESDRYFPSRLNLTQCAMDIQGLSDFMVVYHGPTNLIRLRPGKLVMLSTPAEVCGCVEGGETSVVSKGACLVGGSIMRRSGIALVGTSYKFRLHVLQMPFQSISSSS